MIHVTPQHVSSHSLSIAQADSKVTLRQTTEAADENLNHLLESTSKPGDIPSVQDDHLEQVPVCDKCHQEESKGAVGSPERQEDNLRTFQDASERIEVASGNSLSKDEESFSSKETKVAWEIFGDQSSEGNTPSRKADNCVNSSPAQGTDSFGASDIEVVNGEKCLTTQATDLDSDVQSSAVSCQEFLDHSEISLPIPDPSPNGNNDQTCATQEPFAFFDELPRELFFKILSYFTAGELCLTVAPVCRDWYDCSRSPVLWTCLDLSDHRDVSHKQLCAVLGRASLLKSLSLRGREELSLGEMQALASCPLLTDLNLGFCDNVNGRVLDEIIRCCLHLEVINMEGCERIDDDVASQFPSLPHLKALNLSHCTKMTDDGVMAISKGCRLLEELNVDGIPWITDRAVDVLASQRAQTLRAIYLDGAELTDVSIRSLMGCPLLHTLSLSFCEQLTDKALSMLEMLDHLSHLRLKRGVEFSEEALHRFFECGRVDQLTILDLSECSELMDKGVTSIARRCRQLRRLALCWCWNISDAGIKEIVDNCSQLRHLDIVGLDKVKGQCLSRIPESLPQLTFLDLRQCNLINDNMLIDLVKVRPHLLIFNYYGEHVTRDMIP
ncbi:F-box/LRR-repeat protein 20-like [Acanthaster planci]|uniref:F-box/LRR-repeat protein 20-like n=1 Tax=Acanthaster planci TaxID=133434 RepID=A0A8B7XHC3_ACAPL|nr:F-box/LRR-repeat protein 20-like [Acanthaster planci]